MSVQHATCTDKQRYQPRRARSQGPPFILCVGLCRTHDNFFYQADGFKMDFGGHDSIFSSNVVIVRPYDGQNCQNMWSFVPGHQDILYNNTCIIMHQNNPQDVNMVLNQNDGDVCDGGPSSAILYNNRYYTRDGNASVICGGKWGTTIVDLREKYPHFERGSTMGKLSDITAEFVIQLGRDVLHM